MTKQEQEVKGSGLTIQSARDTTVNQGLKPEDLRQIVQALSEQLPAFASIAREIVDARLKDFEERVLERFTDTKSARADAFKDPDFQYLLVRAQHAYARSGDAGVRDTLIDLIAQRSKQTERNRLALSLNEAVEKSSVLTVNEFAELSLIYLFKHTIHSGIVNIDYFINFLNSYVSPLLPDISENNSSYSYLEAQACGNISISGIDLRKIFINNYGGVLAKGFDKDQLETHLPTEHKDAFGKTQLLIPCLNNPEKLQFSVLNKKIFAEQAGKLGLTSDQIDSLWAMFENTMWSKGEIIENLKPKYMGISELFRLWEKTPLKNIRLTSVGIAIGHANLVRLSGLDADLSIWIQ